MSMKDMESMIEAPSGFEFYLQGDRLVFRLCLKRMSDENPVVNYRCMLTKVEALKIVQDIMKMASIMT